MQYNPWFVSGQWVEAPAWPAVVGGVAVVLTAGATVVAWAPLARQGPRRAATPVLGGVGGALIGALLAASPLAVAMTEPLLPGEAIPSAWAHALPLEIAAVITIVAAACAGAAGAAGLAGEGASRMLSAPAVGLAGLAIVPAVGWAGWLLSFGPVPLVRPTEGVVHAGRTARPTGTLLGNVGNAWTLEANADVVAPQVAGPLPADVVAAQGPVRTGVACAIEVGLDTEDPRLPLAVGNQWTFGSSLEQRVTIAPLLLGVWDLGTSRTSGTEGLRVTGVREDGPLRYRTVLGTHGETVEVYGWNGTTRTRDGAPLFVDRQGGVESGAMPGWLCTYGAAEGGTLGLPGPTGCTRRTGTAGDYLTSAVVGVATAGLWIPDPNAKGALVPLTSGNVP